MAGIVIIGAGLAGLFTALKLSPLPVTVLSPTPLGEGASSMWAQGGIAAAVGEGDTPEAHARDTIAAGAGIVDEQIARMVASEAPDRIRDLLRYGVPFDRDLEGHFLLSREAAHSAKRIVRVSGDRAGAAIMAALIATVRATPSIRVLEGWEAFGILPAGDQTFDVMLRGQDGNLADRRFASSTCHLTVQAYNVREPAQFAFVQAGAAILATGGIGQLYALTTNPVNSRGQGIAMAAHAGAVIADAEFVQFHPTAIDVGLDPAPLASEALRGEGAVLVNKAGHRFMVDQHPDADLAPRDVVARSVFRELQAGRGAYLDCTKAIGRHFATAFPTIYAHCQRAGIDPSIDHIPVAPAEHFHMGGVETDQHGRTSVAGLWAVGEVASTGLHGANRLASNSLLEAVVYGARAAEDVAAAVASPAEAPLGRYDSPLPAWKVTPEAQKESDDAIAQVRRELTAKVGVERSGETLRSALRDLSTLRERALGPHPSAMLTTATFITAAALAREESRGGHFRTDFPEPRAELARRSRYTLADIQRIKQEALA